MKVRALHWFRLDLRLSDNPALDAAAESGFDIIPVFIWAPEEDGGWPPGSASRWWLHQSLQSLDNDLKRRGSGLVLRRGPSGRALRSLVRESGARKVFWNRRCEPALRRRDAVVRETLSSEGIQVETCNSALMFEPEEIKNRTGGPFRVFTPFWNACLASFGPDFSGNAPEVAWERGLPESIPLQDLKLQPEVDWAGGLRRSWKPGESGARELLDRFSAGAMDAYAEKRDYPAFSGTSRLSPHLHFGEISPHRIRAACAAKKGNASAEFLRQLGWREFAHHLLFHFPETPERPLRAQFERFPWRRDRMGLKRWQRGGTGFPIVDAGMRELWATGWMHNRVRMIAASLLVKHLLISWTEGARWFWDTLVDADLANNTLGWQWVAGCGADAAPYYRIFNPALQAAKFDPGESYIRNWIPELKTPEYPGPVVDHRTARQRALEALASIKRQLRPARL
ncbi:MAG: deoxyribodipyrimidine photo-lyase [Acidobacteria bacterium]|nr:deoxyribodipyrimidine photo-lyase [Acidobacteriota bacterium]